MTELFGTGKREKVEKKVEKEEKMQVKKKKEEIEEKARSVSGRATKPSLLQAVCAKLCQ